jgi:hypothetical protein
MYNMAPEPISTVLNKSLSLCIPLPFLSNGSKNYLATNTTERNNRIVECVVFCAAHVVEKRAELLLIIILQI